MTKTVEITKTEIDAITERTGNMTALGILKEMQRNPRALLWLNSDRREACLHDGEIARPVDYNEARVARTDPALRIIDTTDGETLAA